MTVKKLSKLERKKIISLILNHLNKLVENGEFNLEQFRVINNFIGVMIERNLPDGAYPTHNILDN